jgi:alpha-glucosidase (family GH31 glycosyl hydrolase)
LHLFTNRFPTDANALNVDAQMMWGSAVVISPVLVEVRYVELFRIEIVI